MSSSFNPYNNSVREALVAPHFTDGELRSIEIKVCYRGFIASKWQSQESNVISLTLDSMLMLMIT